MIVAVIQCRFPCFDAGIRRGLIQLPLQKESFFLYFSFSFKAPFSPRHELPHKGLLCFQQEPYNAVFAQRWSLGSYLSELI